MSNDKKVMLKKAHPFKSIVGVSVINLKLLIIRRRGMDEIKTLIILVGKHFPFKNILNLYMFFTICSLQHLQLLILLLFYKVIFICFFLTVLTIATRQGTGQRQLPSEKWLVQTRNKIESGTNSIENDFNSENFIVDNTDIKPELRQGPRHFKNSE